MDKFSVVCQWSDEDEGYIALVPELRGLSAFGETATEALQELEIAKEAYLKVFEEDGCDLPEPRKLPEFSGQLRLRLPKWLHAELSREADREGVSLNTHIVSLLSDRNRTAKIQKDLSVIKNCQVRAFTTGSIQNPSSVPSSSSTIGQLVKENLTGASFCHIKAKTA